MWLSLFNGDSSLVRSDGGVPTTEILLLLPTEPNVTYANAFLIETICTFVFVEINLLVKTGKTAPTEQGFLKCLAVAFTLLAMICVSGSKTGACLNPAVGVAQTLFGIFQFGRDIPTDLGY